VFVLLVYFVFIGIIYSVYSYGSVCLFFVYFVLIGMLYCFLWYSVFIGMF